MARHIAILGLIMVALAGCGHVSHRGPAAAGAIPEATDELDAAVVWRQRASSASGREGAVRAALACSANAYRALEQSAPRQSDKAISLASECTQVLLHHAMRSGPRRWTPGPVRIGGVPVTVEFRDLPDSLTGNLALMEAAQVPIPAGMGPRQVTVGLGVALVAFTPRCDDRPRCLLFPAEGVFRPVTAWIEAPPTWQSKNEPTGMRLVIGNPISQPSTAIGAARVPLATDTSAPYSRLLQASKLRRLAVWGLLGGDDVGRRSGLHLLNDYDPHRRPIVMIHGLGSSPLTWARLSNAILGDEALRQRYQVWHMVYPTNAPMLVNRKRLETYLDTAWRMLDPEGDDPARSGVVLVGHSMGGVLSRLLCASSGEALWSAAFTAPPSSLQGDTDDIALVDDLFHFEPYPGVSRVIFLATPHAGTSRADRGLGRLVKALIGRRSKQLEPLRRVALQNPSIARPEVMAVSRLDRLSSITTLGPAQPVMLAARTLMPAAGIRYNTIAGNHVQQPEPGDGVVPLSSALLPGADSTLVIDAQHEVHATDQAVQEVLRILRSDADR